MRIAHQTGVSHQNGILAALGSAELAALKPHLRIVQTRLGEVIAEAHTKIPRVYFPHNGILSYVIALSDGETLETAMVGRDGVAGAGPVIEDQVSLSKINVQVAGTASVIDSAKLRELVQQLPALRSALLRHELLLHAQSQQTAACNAVHSIEERLSRWLLRMQHLAGDELPVTQESLAQMLGVRRTSVTMVAGALQNIGAIRYRRGLIQVIDVDKLKEVACECFETVQRHHGALLGPA